MHPEHPLKKVLTQAEGIILGKQKELRLALACLLAGGHLLIEDLPGLGKPPWPTPWPSC